MAVIFHLETPAAVLHWGKQVNVGCFLGVFLFVYFRMSCLIFYFILFLRQRTLIDYCLHCSVQTSVGNMVKLVLSKLFYQKKKPHCRKSRLQSTQDLLYSDRWSFLLGLGGNKFPLHVNKKFLWEQYYFEENAFLEGFLFPRYRIKQAQRWEGKSLVSHTKM